ncbi:UNKNOWN [Stylonychia lemnae]|uniref:Uncharacterized protein n=1 Tax=Stylonychia lemnae TaxID=5949 RepID=A0A078A4Z5_STYLE|nr:UNKNOWN [Stylonychia lemnae]|eukprot:CDW75819.1 UNKNOWN [Stylonychia lemnae]
MRTHIIIIVSIFLLFLLIQQSAQIKQSLSNMRLKYQLAQHEGHDHGDSTNKRKQPKFNSKNGKGEIQGIIQEGSNQQSNGTTTENITDNNGTQSIKDSQQRKPKQPINYRVSVDLEKIRQRPAQEK